MKKVLLFFTHLMIVFSSCPPGWKEFVAQTGCYYIDLRPMAFLMAERSCQEMRPASHLLSIHNVFQNEMIKEELNLNGFMNVLWIGFNNISSAQWEWIDASPNDYLNKCPGFPTNTDNKCAKFTKQGCWQDSGCSELSAFVCGISFPVQPSTPSTVIYSTTTTTVIQPTTTTTANACSDGFTLMEDGYCYYVSDARVTFDDANRDCQARGAHLVSMHNYWENLIAVKFVLYAHEVLHQQKAYLIWIGLQCHNASLSSCGWTDGSRFDYSAILANNIDSVNYWGAIDISAPERGRWRTWAGSYVFPFVCKHRSSVVVPETSDNQLPNCNIGYWSADSNTTCYGFESLIDDFWSVCDAWCVQIGGRCASIHNRQQNSEIYALYQTTQPPSDFTTNGFHIGLKENGTTWYWVDGTPYDNSFWAPGYPLPGQMPYVSAATNGLWATGAIGADRSMACRQNQITQQSNNMCPTGVYFGMGEIRSPGFPENYAFNYTCTYTLYDNITADPPIPIYIYWPRTKLAVYFITFVTHPLDVVEIFDGPNVNSPLIASVSGIAGAKQGYYSTGYNMTIRFISRVGNNFKGWRAVFGPYTTRP